MTDVPHTKSELRARLKTDRAAFVEGLEPEVLDGAFSTLPRQLWPLFAPATTIGLHLSTSTEAPSTSLIDFVRDSRRSVALPRLDDGTMSFRLWSEGEPLEEGPHNIFQPGSSAHLARPELLLVPLIGFDAKLRRLGRGGGHYDRWLAAHPATRTIGLAWSVQEVEHIPVEPHDHSLDAVLTERAVLMKAATQDAQS